MSLFTSVSANETAPLPYQLENQHIYNPFQINNDEPELKRTKSCTKSPVLTRSPSVKRFQRRKSRLSITTTTTPRNSSHLPVEDLSEHEFSFSEGSPSITDSDIDNDLDLDLESLPESESNQTTPNTSPLSVKASKQNSFPFFISRNSKFSSSYFEQEFTRQIQEDKEEAQDIVIEPELIESGPSIFQIPEILHKIIGYVDIQNTVIPQEGITIRRKPLSFNHAMMTYGNKYDAIAAMNQSNINNEIMPFGTLYNCLLVNKLFHQITKEFLSKKFFFSSEFHYMKYIQHQQQLLKSQNCIKASPSMIVLHKLFLTRSETIATLNQSLDFSNLEWIELFMCPKLLPSPAMFDQYGYKIKKFIVTGSKTLDDSFLIHLSKRCPNLEVLDIRACELVTDSGIYSIGKYCKKLKVINFGRKLKGHLITDNSLSILIKNNPNLNTIGLAGCCVTDKVIWDIAIHCNSSIERLSLNNCQFITNQSIPLILHSNYLPNLSVLELRFVENLTNFLPIIEFKRRQEFRGISILIEVCEILCAKMKSQEIEMDRAISKRIFKDILEYVNDNDDEDLSHINLINERRRAN